MARQQIGTAASRPLDQLTVADLLGSFGVRRRPRQITGLIAGQDNTATINNALAAANPYDVLVMPRGDWTHSATIVHGKSDLTVEGYGARLLATVPRYGGYRITADNAVIRGMTHEVVGATARGAGENYDDCPWSAWDVANVRWEDVESVGSRDSQFFVSGVTGATLSNLVGRDSFADGLHISGGSRDVVVDGVQIGNPGDDGVAVVSYVNDARACSNIRISRIGVVNSAARGVTIAGGSNIRYQGVRVTRCRAGGIYIAHEQGSFNTSPVSDASVFDADLTDCNWDSGLDQGSVSLVNLVSGTVMRRVVVAGVVARENRKFSEGVPYATVKNAGGGGGRFQGCKYQDINLLGGTVRGEVFVDGVSNARVASGSYSYQSGSGTGVTTNSEGYVVAGSGNLAEAGTTTSSPGFTMQRVRGGALYSTP